MLAGTPLALASSSHHPINAMAQSDSKADPNNSSLVIPLVGETLSIDRRTVETGRVRIEKTIETEQTVVDESVTREEVRIERRPVNVAVERDAIPVPRTEGDTTIIPILEEVLVVEKRLMLREELRITRVRHTERSPREVTLHREQVRIERTREGGAPEDASERSVS